MNKRKLYKIAVLSMKLFLIEIDEVGVIRTINAIYDENKAF